MHLDIILPTIGRDSLRTAIESIVNQSFKQWRLYVVHDLGTVPDRHLVIDERIDWLCLQRWLPSDGDSGTAARNFGISYGNNEWIAYLDDDDVWLPNHLSTILSLREANPDATMIKTAGQSFSWRHKSPRSSELKRKLSAVNNTDILTPGMAHTRELFNRTRGWQNGTAHDKDLWNNMLKVGGVPIITNEITFQFER